ncbi:hypothetical protein Tco_0694462 [Tanacetum coccineum]
MSSHKLCQVLIRHAILEMEVHSLMIHSKLVADFLPNVFTHLHNHPGFLVNCRNDAHMVTICPLQVLLIDNPEPKPTLVTIKTLISTKSFKDPVIHQPIQEKTCAELLAEEREANIDQSPPQEMSIQDMEDLKQHYLNEIKSLINDLQIKGYRKERIDIQYRRECEIRIDDLKQNLNGMSIEIRKKEKELLQQEQAAYVSTSQWFYFIYDDDDDEESSIPLSDVEFKTAINPDSGDSTIDVVEDIPVDVPNILPTHPTLHMDFDFITSHNDLGSDHDVSSPSGDRNKIYDPEICIKVESTRSLATLSAVINTLLPFSSENKDKFFNHGVLASKEKSLPSSSHRGFKASKLFHHKSPMLIHGENIPIMDVSHVRHSRLMDDFDKFIAKEGESLESVYERLTTLVNIMDHNNVRPTQLQFEPHVLASKVKKAAKNHYLLALLVHSNAFSSQSHANSSYSPQPYYVTHPSSVVDYGDEYRGELHGDSQEDKLITTMMLLARAIMETDI